MIPLYKAAILGDISRHCQFVNDTVSNVDLSMNGKLSGRKWPWLDVGAFPEFA
jgi:hypothetical protein